MVVFTVNYGEQCPNIKEVEKTSREICNKCRHKEYSTRCFVVCNEDKDSNFFYL